MWTTRSKEVLLSYIINQIIPIFPNFIEDNCLIKAEKHISLSLYLVIIYGFLSLKKDSLFFTQYPEVCIFWFHTQTVPCSRMFISVKLWQNNKPTLTTIKSNFFLMHILKGWINFDLVLVLKSLWLFKMFEATLGMEHLDLSTQKVLQVSVLEVYKIWLNKAVSNLFWPWLALLWAGGWTKDLLKFHLTQNTLQFYNPKTLKSSAKKTAAIQITFTE